ncbi:MAG: hypothetical protein AAB448_03500 [Patescibacteria group bacterium]
MSLEGKFFAKEKQQPGETTKLDINKFIEELIPKTESSEKSLYAVRLASERSRQNIRNTVENFFKYQTVNLKRSPGEVTAELTREVERTKESAVLSYNTNLKRLLEILDSGRIKNMFDFSEEEKREKMSFSSDPLGYDFRRRATERVLGWGENEHPLYLALDDADDDAKNGSANHYGDIRIQFDLDTVTDNTYFVEGDSMSELSIPYALLQHKENKYKQKTPEGAVNPELRQLSAEHAFISKAMLRIIMHQEDSGITDYNFDKFGRCLTYIEAHVGTSLSLQEAKQIQVPMDKFREQVAALYKNEMYEKFYSIAGPVKEPPDDYYWSLTEPENPDYTWRVEGEAAENLKKQITKEKTEQVLDYLKKKCSEYSVHLKVTERIW